VHYTALFIAKIGGRLGIFNLKSDKMHFRKSIGIISKTNGGPHRPNVAAHGIT